MKKTIYLRPFAYLLSLFCAPLSVGPPLSLGIEQWSYRTIAQDAASYNR